MGKIARQTRAEFRQLPLMLGKTVGGLAAVLGFMVTVWTATRTSGVASGNSLLPLVLGGVGLVVFVVCDRALARRSSTTAEELEPADRWRTNGLAWVLLLLFVGIVLAVTGFLAS